MYSALPECGARKRPEVLVDWWGPENVLGIKLIEELVSESSKPAELRASSSFSLASPENALRNGTRNVAVAKEKGGSGMKALPGVIASQCCRKIGGYVTLIACQEDKLAAEERRSVSSVMMSAAARSQSKPLSLPEKKGKGPT